MTAIALTIWSLFVAAAGYFLGRTDLRKQTPTPEQRSFAARASKDMRLAAMKRQSGNN